MYFSFYPTGYDFKPICFSSKSTLFYQKKFLTEPDDFTLHKFFFSIDLCNDI